MHIVAIIVIVVVAAAVRYKKKRGRMKVINVSTSLRPLQLDC